MMDDLRDVNWNRVLFLSLLGFMLVMLFWAGTASAASVWDSRDPEIQKVQGAVQGTLTYTIPSMKRFAATLERKLGKDAVVTLYARIAELEAYAQKLSRDREVGAVMREKDPKLVKLYQYVAAANEPMFALMRRVAQSGK